MFLSGKGHKILDISLYLPVKATNLIIMYLSMYLTKIHQKIEIFIKYPVQNMDLVPPDLHQVGRAGQEPRNP